MEMCPFVGTKMSHQGGKEAKPGDRMLLTPTQMSRWFQCQPYEGTTYLSQTKWGEEFHPLEMPCEHSLQEKEDTRKCVFLLRS